MIVYNYKCSSCNAEYIGSSKLQFKVRVDQHLGVSSRTDAQFKDPSFSAVRNHCRDNDHPLNRKDFAIVSKCKSETEVRTMESIITLDKKPSIGDNSSAVKLYII